MSTNLLEFFGVIGQTAVSLRDQLDAMASDADTYDHDKVDHPTQASLENLSQKIIDWLVAHRGALPVADYRAVLDSWTVAPALSLFGPLLGNAAPPLLPPNRHVLTYLGDNKHKTALDACVRAKRRKLYHKSNEFRWFVDNLRECLTWVSWQSMPALVVIHFKSFESSWSDQDYEAYRYQDVFDLQ